MAKKRLPEFPAMDVKTSEEVWDTFGINFLKLHYLRPELFFLQLPNSLFRYPTSYVNALKEQHQESGNAKINDTASSFAASEEAASIIQAESDHLSYCIEQASEDGLLRASSVVRMLKIGRSTLTGWEERGDLEVERVNGRIWIPEGAIREAAQWHLPENFQSPTPEST